MKTSLRSPEEYAKFFSRQYSLFQSVCLSECARVFQRYGVTTSIRLEGSVGWVSFFNVRNDLDRFYTILLDHIKNDKEFLAPIFKEMEETGEAFVENSKKIAKNSGSSLEEFSKSLEAFNQGWNAHVPAVWLTFLVGEVGGILFEELLRALPEEKHVEALTRYSHPSKRAHVLTISDFFHKEKDETKRIKYLEENYPWLFTTDLFSPKTTSEQYLDYARSFKEKEEHPFAGPDLFPEELLPMVEIYQDILYMKDKRDEYRRRAFFAVQPLVERIEATIGVSRKDLWYSRAGELIRYGTDREEFGKVIEERRNGYIFESDGNEGIFLEGEVARSAFLEKKHSGDVTEVKGVSGCKGKVTGVAQVVTSSEQCRDFEEVRILVATTTNPDYIAAMQKAVAFVTDEGGITCHAAIVAREMKKPCIVGTKIGTKVFKTGDSIEVDAERGIVRKL